MLLLLTKGCAGGQCGRKSDTNHFVVTNWFEVGVDGPAVRNMSVKNSASHANCSFLEFGFPFFNSELFWSVVFRHVTLQQELPIAFILAWLAFFPLQYLEKQERRLRFPFWTVLLTSCCIISASRGTRQIWQGVNLSLAVSGTALTLCCHCVICMYSIYKWPHCSLFHFAVWHNISKVMSKF